MDTWDLDSRLHGAMYGCCDKKEPGEFEWGLEVLGSYIATFANYVLQPFLHIAVILRMGYTFAVSLLFG